MSAVANNTPAERPTLFPALLAHYALVQPDAPALISAAGEPCHYAELYTRITRMGELLRQAGIGRNGRVGIAIEKPIELAHAIVAVMCHAVVVPLDPTLTAAEIAALHARLHFAAVLTDGRDSPLPGWRSRDGSSLFSYGEQRSTSAENSLAPDSWACIARSSGTTAEPKLIPFTHGNLVARIARVKRWLALTPQDRALCIAKLHYGFGLQTQLLTPLAAGASVAFPIDNSNDERGVLRWFEELQPTYYSGSPAFQMSVLERIKRCGKIPSHCLRLIQSGGAQLSDETRQSLHTAFQVPILEAYGLSETGQLSSSTAADASQGNGAVGRPDADSIMIVNAAGKEVQIGETGELLTRGNSLSPGYIDAEGDLQVLSHDAWFRTGDLACFDHNGFLRLVGRIKDIINRGGEKISPTEVDAILLRHPDIMDAATFAIPHPRLGEDIAAAVVLCAGRTTSAHDLRQHMSRYLEPFKIPHVIRKLDALPRNTSGKIVRQKLRDEYLTLAPLITPAETAYPSSRSPLEVEVLALFEKLLHRADLSPLADFFEQGGDSLLAAQLHRELEALVGHSLPDNLLFNATTTRQLVDTIMRGVTGNNNLLVPLRREGTQQPLIFFHGDLNGGGYYMRRLAPGFAANRPIWLLQPFDAASEPLPSFEAMGNHYLQLLGSAGLKPPYLFAGHCNGALLALETARQAEATGAQVSLLMLIDPISINARRPIRFIATILRSFLRISCQDPATYNSRFRHAMAITWKLFQSPRVMLSHYRKGQALFNVAPASEQHTDPNWAFEKRMAEFYLAMASFFPHRVNAKIVCFTPESSLSQRSFSNRMWRRFGRDVETIVVPGAHLTCITSHAAELAAKLQQKLTAH